MTRILSCIALICALEIPIHAAAPTFSFLTRTDLLDPGAVQIVSADFNGDGIADLASLGESDIRVFLGDGLGDGNSHFRLASVIPLPGTPMFYSQLLVADFNLDGKPDLAVFGGTGFLLLGNGDGTFKQGVNFPATSSPAAVADFNGDGKPDLAASTRGGIAVLLGIGNGTFQAPLVIPGSVSNVGCLAAGDLNGDGRPDLATCNVVYLGKGNGTFKNPVAFTLPSPADFVTIADLNNDGKADLVAIKQYLNGVNPALGPIYILFGNGDGTFQPTVQVQTDVGTLFPNAAIGDINCDGWPDIAVLGAGGQVGILTNNGNRTFTRDRVLDVTFGYGVPWSAVTLADLTGDHHLDIVAAGNASRYFSVLFHNRHGGFGDVHNLPIPNASSISTTGNATPVARADFNGDGLPDLAFVDSQNSAVYISTVLQTGNPSQPFQAGPNTSIDLSSFDGVNGIATGDFNHDGNPDLAICFYKIDGANLPGTVKIFLGNGDGTFTETSTTIRLPLTSFEMISADFNGDGIPDLAFATGQVALGNGDGTFGPLIDFFQSNPNYFGVWLQTADFNHDGNLDIALQVCQSCEIPPPLLIFLGNGDGTFQPPASYTWNGLATWGTIADLNHDGIPDIVALSYAEDVNSPIAAIFLGTGDGTFQPPTYVEAIWAGQPNQVIAADLNGDGRVDLAVTDWWLNTVYLFAGNGDGTFGPQIEIGGPVSPGRLFSGNLQGQTTPGFPDLFTVDFGPNGFFPPQGSGMAVSVLFNTSGKEPGFLTF